MRLLISHTPIIFQHQIFTVSEKVFTSAEWQDKISNTQEECYHRRCRGKWYEDEYLGRCKFPLGPRNTWSNAAYFLAALVVLIGDFSANGLVMALSLTALGAGSALYHGFKTLWANKLDRVGMYLTFGALVIHGHQPDPSLWIAMLATGVLMSVLLVYIIPTSLLDLQMGILLWLSGVPAILKGFPQGALISLGLFVIGYAAWQCDHRRKFVGLWGHAIWHILTAFAIALMYFSQGW